MKRLFLVLTMVAALGAMTTTANAVIVDTVAYFDGGVSTDVPDAYVGMTGEGWRNAWAKKTSGTVNNPTVTDTAPLYPGNGNYLKADFTATSTTTLGSQGAIYRNYITKVSELYFGEDFNISFDVRIDPETTLDGDRDRFSFAINQNGKSYGQPTDTFFLSGRSVGWRVIDGWDEVQQKTVFVNISEVTMGNYLYNVSVNVHPTAYTCDLTLTNVTLTESVTLNGLEWRGPEGAGDLLGPYVTFSGCETTQNQSISFSLDNVVISQEITPGTMQQVVNYFDNGESTDYPDAYMGAHGDGWQGEWGSRTHSGSISATRTVESTNELHTGDGNYLKVVTANADDLPSTYSIARSYKASGGVDFTDDHSVSFTVRIDETDIGDPYYGNMSAADDQYFITSTVLPQGGMNAEDTFAILAQGAAGQIGPNGEVALDAGDAKEWVFANGDGAGGITSYTSSEIALVSDGVYDFTITYDVDMKTYDVTLSDGTNSVTVENLGWITADTIVGGMLNFGASAGDTYDTRNFSLDNIVIESLSEDYIPGDANKDGFVDGSDATILANYWQYGVGMTIPDATWEMGDFNGDHIVDGSDATLLASHWQEGTPPSSAVPEPSTVIGLITLLLAGLALARRR